MQVASSSWVVMYMYFLLFFVVKMNVFGRKYPNLLDAFNLNTTYLSFVRACLIKAHTGNYAWNVAA